MRKNRSTKRALLMSGLALFACISMLVGSTFAWFTDSVVSANNIIKSGNLDVELYYQVEGQTDWAKVDENTNVFMKDALWEPGHTEVVKLKVVNEGSLALKYQLGVNVASEIGSVNVYGDSFKLSDYIKFGIVEGDQSYTRDTAVAAVDATANWLKTAYASETIALEPKDEKIVTMVVYMPTSVDNKANYAKGEVVPTINLGINLFATQYTSESDSFGPDYDENAWIKGMKVYSAADLKAAIANGETSIVLMSNIEADETIIIPEGADIALNLNGKTVTGTMHKNDGAVLKNNGTLAITGGTISSTADNGGSAVANNGTLTIDNATLNGAPNANGSWPSYTVNNAGVMKMENTKVTSYHGGVASYGDGAVATLNNCELDMSGIPGFTSHGFYTYNNGAIIVNGGTYANKATDQNATGASVINGAVTVNGGAFTGRIENYYGTPVIKGGSFSVEPKANFVDAGYKTVEIDGTYYVVANEVAGVVTKPEAMKDALTSAGAAGAGNTTIAFFGDIDMTGTAWTPIKVDGYHGADIVTIEGNGATITGLTAPLFAGGFAGGSGIVIKDLTIADSNIVSNNTLGSGAFIESVDSMAKIELNNCHLVNSTVTGGNGSRTGGLIGWTAGYSNVNDGPVKTYVTIENCSVIGCTITCDGSVGGIYGHAGNNDWTYSTVKNCVVKNNVLNSTDDGAWRVGVVVGTANVGELTIEGITESGNTLTQTGKTAPAGQSNLFGRFVPGTTGKLVIDGVEVVVSAAAFKDTFNNATAGDVINASGVVVEGTTHLNKPGVTVIGATFKNEDGIAVTQTISGTYKDCVFEGSEALRWCYTTEGDTVVFENCEIKTDFRGFHFDGMAGNVIFKNCKINGFNAYGGEGSITFEGCTFGSDESSYNGLNIYSNTTLIDCKFEFVSGKTNFIDMEGVGKTLTITNCTATLDGADADVADFVGGSKLAQNTVVYN